MRRREAVGTEGEWEGRKRGRKERERRWREGREGE